jgi:Zn-dependent membrane protease YugP
MILILLVFMGIGFIVQMQLKRRFDKYGKMALANGLSGKEIAEKMLADHHIHDVRVISVPGKLTDHYNPLDKTVNLSPEVYDGRSVSAAAVAAHECGHAVQHATAYSWLQFRSTMVPVVSFSARAMNILFILMLLGSLVAKMFPLDTVFLLLIVFQAAITLFSVVTLPVEYDASNRALAWLENTGMTLPQEHDKAADALKWAARTYLVAALASITQLVYYIMLYLGNRD